MTLSIIILSYNTAKLTEKCVKSVIAHYKSHLNKDVEVIVVDNFSGDKTMDLLKRIKEIKIIQNNENFGFSKGNNIGAKNSTGKYILFLNSDAKVLDDSFLKMVNFLDENQKVGVLGGKLVDSEGKVQKSGGDFYNLFNLFVSLFGGERMGFVRKFPKKIERIDWVSGACLLTRKDLFNKLKGFDEKFFMYVEDMDLCFRAKKIDFLTYFYPEAKILHEEHGSSNREFAVTNIYKSIIYFSKKHRISTPTVRIMLFVKALFSLLVGVVTNNNYLKRTYMRALRIAV